MKLNEVKALADHKCGQTLLQDDFALLVNETYRVLSNEAKLEILEEFTDISLESGENYFKVTLTEHPLQIMAVVINDIKGFKVGFNDDDQVHAELGFTYHLQNTKDLIIRLTNQSTIKKLKVLYYYPLPDLQYPFDNLNLATTEVPFIEYWHGGIIADYVAKLFWENFEDEEKVAIYDRMFERKLIRFREEVSKRHRFNSSRFSKRNTRR